MKCIGQWWEDTFFFCLSLLFGLTIGPAFLAMFAWALWDGPVYLVLHPLLVVLFFKILILIYCLLYLKVLFYINALAAIEIIRKKYKVENSYNQFKLKKKNSLVGIGMIYMIYRWYTSWNESSCVSYWNYSCLNFPRCFTHSANQPNLQLSSKVEFLFFVLRPQLPCGSSYPASMPQLERTVTRSNSRQVPARRLPPPRGLIKIRVVKTLVSSVTAFASSFVPRPTANGESDGASRTAHTSPSTSPPVPSAYNSDTTSP